MTKSPSVAELLRQGNMIGQALSWTYNAMAVTVTAGFFSVSQGTPMRWLWAYPSCQIPIVLASVAGAMTFFNTTLLEILFFVAACATAAFESGTSYLAEQLGEPAGRFASTIAALRRLFVCVGVCVHGRSGRR